MFPTKVPEYLGSGRPILVHCPDDYSLGDFFRKHDCGRVVADRSDEALLKAWIEVRDHPDTSSRMAGNAHRAVSYFNGQRISTVFKEQIQALMT